MNHWFKGYQINAGALSSKMAFQDLTVGVMVIPWDVQAFDEPFIRIILPEADAHLCGEAHVLEWVSHQLQIRKATGAAPSAPEKETK